LQRTDECNFLAQIWLLWQPPWLPWNFIYHIRIRWPRKPFNYVINSSISGTELKFVQFWLFCLNLVAVATPLAPLKFWIAYLNSPTLKTLLLVRKSSRFLAQKWILCNFGFFLPKFGCHSNSLGSLEILDSYLNSSTPKTLWYTQRLCRYLVHKWSYSYLNVWHLYYYRYRQFYRFLQKIVENVFLIKPQMGTRIHRNTSSEPLTTFLRRTMWSRQDVLFDFGSFLPKFGCHDNSLGSLEILGSILEIADPKNPTIYA